MRHCFIFKVKILIKVRFSENLLILLNSLWKFSSLLQRRLDFVCKACLAWPHFLYTVWKRWSWTGKFSYFPQLWLLEWGWNGLKNVSKGLRDVEERWISARKAGQLWGLTRAWNQHCLRVGLNSRVTFDRRIEVKIAGKKTGSLIG